jgi:hypothetical protein
MFVCIVACSDQAPPAAVPSTGSAEPAAMIDTESSAAGAPADSGGVPAVPSAASAPAAADSGIDPATPSAAGAPAAAGSGMASTGSAGSRASANPSAAANCELPNSYTRAARLTLELTWPETIAFVAGAGTLAMWAKVTYTRSSAGALELALRPCGALLPEATASALAGGLKSSTQVPATAFDSPNMPIDRTAVTQREDRSLTFAISTVLGAMLPDPDGAWPASQSLVAFDHDGDGSPGLTALPIEGPDYLAPPSSISQLETLDRLYIATRARVRVSITPACSGAADGLVEPLGFNSSVVGCHVKGRDECTASEMQFIANGSPRYMLGASGTWTEVEVPPEASCTDVRAALPAP